jgi:hypothetical protein
VRHWQRIGLIIQIFPTPTPLFCAMSFRIANPVIASSQIVFVRTYLERSENAITFIRFVKGELQKIMNYVFEIQVIM